MLVQLGRVDEAIAYGLAHLTSTEVALALAPVESGTRFEREFVYTMPSPLLKVLDFLVVRRRIQAESAQAVRQLQARLQT